MTYKKIRNAFFCSLPKTILQMKAPNPTKKIANEMGAKAFSIKADINNANTEQSKTSK